jgi:hypothetical protein
VGLGLNARYAVIKETAQRYRRARKKEKSRILDEFLELTRYNRKYAIHVLANYGKKKRLEINGTVIEATVGVRQRKKYSREPTYGEEVKEALTKIWIVYDCICGKRLRAVLAGQMEVLKNCRTFAFEEAVWEKLARIRASTIDRLLKTQRPKEVFKGRSYTKPGSMLKHHIPIRRGTDWDEKTPGFFEVDLVGHDGGNAGGEFAFSLNMTDVATGWTEPLALKNKAQKWAFAGIVEVQGKLPMKLAGIDSDNGSEFINAHLFRYCEGQGIKFTRSRPNRKNDNCFVEQKNYSVIRRYVGYCRYDTDEEVALLNELYARVRLHINFFLPSMKLKEKLRVGSKIIKRYDEAKTPYQRLLESGIVTAEARGRLEEEFRKLNPVVIQRKVADLQGRLLKIVLRKERSRERGMQGKMKKQGYPNRSSD